MIRSSNGIQLLVGSYSPKGQQGVHWIRFSEEADSSFEKIASYDGIDNPSFLAIADGPSTRLYAVSETAGGAIVSLQLNETNGVIEELNRQPCGGDSPCHLTIDSSRKWLLATNYMSGNIGVFPLEDDGRIGPVAQFIAHSGSSVNKDRQEAPHPHSINEVPGTNLYLACDLGTDAVYVYRLDRDNGNLTLVSSQDAQPGAGPRNLAIHPHRSHVYVIEELTSTITAYELDVHSGSMRAIQTVSTLPDDYDGVSTCAEVAISECGNYVYGSNRGHDSLACFHIASDGRMEGIGHVSTGGRTPRHFTLLPGNRYVIAANQDTNNLVAMKLDENGIPQATASTLELHQPVCLKWLPVSSK